ncbi:MAG: hypothetical protein RJB39_573 [Candidatus Parcubacteria bacterium]|jgi:hypothetical protein
MLDITKQNIDELLDPTCGATVIGGGEFQHTSLLPFADALRSRFKVPPPGNLVSNYSFTCLSDRPQRIWEDFSTAFAQDLNNRLLPQLPFAEQLTFDDLYLTYYPPSVMGVGCHRDTNCKGLVLAYVLEGTLPFFICKDKDMNQPQQIIVQPGQILAMRAAQIGDLPRPYHFVGEVKDPVLQLGLRQYINPNQ